MIDRITELIRGKSYHDMLAWINTLTDKNRLDALALLVNFQGVLTQERGCDTALDVRVLHYLQLCCCRSQADLYRTVSQDAEPNLAFSALGKYMSQPAFEPDALITYFSLFPPTEYLQEVVVQLSREDLYNNYFPLLWALYKADYVSYEEEVFVRSLFIVPPCQHSEVKALNFLIAHPEVLQKVFLKFYRHILPILNVSTWTALDNSEVSGKWLYFWEAVLMELIHKGKLSGGELISPLMATLSYSKEQKRIDWHIRLLKMINPSKEELLDNQELLIDALASTHSSVSLFIISCMEQIYKEERFNRSYFLQTLPLLFVNEGVAASAVTALNMVEELVEEHMDLMHHIPVFVQGFMQPEAVVQEKVAQLLVSYLPHNALKELIEPYKVLLLKEALHILEVDFDKAHERELHQEEEVSLIATEHLEVKTMPTSTVIIYPEVAVPTSWEELLVLLDRVLYSQKECDFDLFYQAIIKLQDEFPENYRELLKVYQKKLHKTTTPVTLLYLLEFMQNWTSTRKYYKSNPYLKPYRHFEAIPLLVSRGRWVFRKLLEKDRLPLLSAISHAPFYLSPEVFITRLLAYEEAKKPVELEDLIVACNRLLVDRVSDEVREQAKGLRGNYKAAIHYLLGLTDKLVPTEELLPLWTQVARTRDVGETFKVFEKTSARFYPTVVEPFIWPYEVRSYYADNQKKPINYLWMNRNWTNYSFAGTSEETFYPALFNYTGRTIDVAMNAQWVKHQIALMPHYFDGLIMHGFAMMGSKNATIHLSYCVDMLQFLLEHQLRVHHSGWLFIATCLVMETKEIRQLAANYLKMASDQGFLSVSYTSNALAKLLSRHFAPLSRITDYLSASSDTAITKFKLQISARTIIDVDKNNPPAHLASLVNCYKELCRRLDRSIDAMIIGELKGVKC